MQFIPIKEKAIILFSNAKNAHIHAKMHMYIANDKIKLSLVLTIPAGKLLTLNSSDFLEESNVIVRSKKIITKIE